MHATATAPDLLSVLRTRKTQAQQVEAAYGPAVAVERDAMLYWLARAAKQLREAAGRKTIHIAARANGEEAVDQSTIWRFEQARAWPKKPDEMVQAYAEDLDVDPFLVWEEALRLWRDDRDQRVAELGPTDPEDAGGGESAAER